MRILRQGLSFGVIGAAQLIPDWGLFVIASALGAPVSLSNLAGRLAGAGLGYWLNGRVTFRGTEPFRLVGRSLHRFAVMWLTLTLVSTLAMIGVRNWAGLEYAWSAKPVVELMLAAISFVVCRYWVYR